MAVRYEKTQRMFQLDTANTTYLIGITPEGYVGHVYYGDHLGETDGYYLLRTEEPPYTPEINGRDKSDFLDSFPMEYPTGGIGDYRESCMNVRSLFMISIAGI